MNFKKLIKSFSFAFKGLISLLKSENNFQFHFAAMILVIACGFMFKISQTDWYIILILFALVFSAEAFNTGLEKLCDFVHPEHHPKIGIIKDIAAAGVLIVAMVAAIIGLLIFYPKVF